MPTNAAPDGSYCEYPAWRCAVSAWSLLAEGFGTPAIVSCLFASRSTWARPSRGLGLGAFHAFPLNSWGNLSVMAR